MKALKRSLAVFLLSILALTSFLLLIVAGGAVETPPAQASSANSHARYAEHWSTGDPYTHDLLVQRYGITAEQLDGFLDSLGISYNKSRKAVRMAGC